jgi:hypothetical protein
MFTIINVTEPATAAVSASELKEYLRIDNSLEDARLDIMARAATRTIEEYLSIKIIDQTLDIFMDRFPMSSRNLWFDGVREMPVSETVTPLRNLTMPIGNTKEFVHFKTFDDNGEFLEDLLNYNVDLVGQRCRLGLKLSGVWPQTVLRSVNGINFRIKAGWLNAAAVPSDIKQSIFELVAHMYENRGDQNEMTVPPHIYTIIDHRKRAKLGL